MPISDWNLEASEEAGQQRALQEEARCSKNCDADVAKNGMCNRYCNNNICMKEAGHI